MKFAVFNFVAIFYIVAPENGPGRTIL